MNIRCSFSEHMNNNFKIVCAYLRIDLFKNISGGLPKKALTVEFPESNEIVIWLPTGEVINVVRTSEASYLGD